MSAQTPSATSIAPSPKWVSFATQLAVTNAVLTSFASANTPTTVTVFTGALGGGPYTAPRTITVTTAAHAASYKTGAPNAITVKGTDGSGAVLTETLLLTATNGGETIVGTKGFLTVTEIDIPAQNDALGSFTFGVQDVVMQFRAVRTGGAGDVKLRCQNDGSVDTIPSMTAGETQNVVGTTLFGDASTTATKITLLA